MKKQQLRITAVLLLFILTVPYASAAEAADKAAKLRLYNDKSLHYQKGYFFVPNRVMQGSKEFPAGSREMFDLLYSYPSSRAEIEKYQSLDFLGWMMIGLGTVMTAGGFYVPGAMEKEPITGSLLGIALVISGAAIGLGGISVINSDTKMNHLYQSIWFYNESLLFDPAPPQADKKTTRNDILIPVFSVRAAF